MSATLDIRLKRVNKIYHEEVSIDISRILSDISEFV